VPEGVELDVEQLTASRTLREVIAILEGLVAGTGGAGPPAAALPPEFSAP